MAHKPHKHTCHFCPREGNAADRSSLPGKDWRWLTRRKEKLDAVAVCPSCVPKHLPGIVLRRFGGPNGRGAARRAAR